MRKDIIERVLNPLLCRKDSIPRQLSVSSQHPGADNSHNTGTTILFMRYKDGILFAGDRKVSYGGYGIKNQEMVKIYSISNWTGMAFAGTVSDGQYIKNILEQVSGGFTKNYGYPLSIRGQAQFVRNTLIDYKMYVNPCGFEADFLIAGKGLSGEFEGYEVTGDGCLFECNYCVQGSGTPYAKTHLDDVDRMAKLKKGDMSLDDAVLTAVGAIFTAAKHDSGSSPIQVALPSVATINDQGFQFMEETKIQEFVDHLLRKGKPSV